MSTIAYNLAKLKQLTLMDVEHELNRHKDPQQLFDKLTDFAENSTKYLEGYSAAIIYGSDSEVQEFLTRVKEIRHHLVTLGMAGALNDLTQIEKSTINKDLTMLTIFIAEFNYKMETASEIIISARSKAHSAVSEESKPVILAVDDQPALLSTVVNILHGEFSVMPATSGKAALKVLEKHTPSLFLLDIEMPVMNGYELASLIRTQKGHAKTPIIFLTAKGQKSDVVAAIQHGGNDYIVKPVNKDLLLSKIRMHLGLS